MLPECSYEYKYERLEDKRIQVDTCYMCESAIYEGDEYYDVLDMTICEDCMKECKKEAEI